jgi:hypothetical protein
MPWKWRLRGERPIGRHRGVFVELFVDGRIRVTPPREELTAEEVRWLDDAALPELREEWAVHVRKEADRKARHPRNAARTRTASEEKAERDAKIKLRYERMAVTYLSYKAWIDAGNDPDDW